MTTASSDICYVYWIRLPEHIDMTKEGYIGISYSPANRLLQHLRNSKSPTDNYNSEFAEALATENYVMDLLICSTRNYCFELENKLRPRWNTAWNIAVGGRGNAVKSEHKIDGKYFSISELGEIFKIKPNTISTRLKRGYSILEAVGLKQKKTLLEFDYEKEMAIFYLENSSMPSNQISKTLGYNSCLRRILKNYKLPAWLFDYFELPDEHGIGVRRLLRNRIFTEFEDFLEIEKEYLEGKAILSIALSKGVSHGSVKKVLEEMEYV